MPVVFREKSVGQHGANIFYKEFSVLTNSNYKTYCLGSFCFVQKPSYPITIAEFQLIWKNTYTNKKYACVKLYFDPEYEDDAEDDDDYAEDFGRDEVIEANRQVVIECCELPYWECSPKLWNHSIGRPAFADISKEYLKKLTNKEHIMTTVAREDMDVKIISYPQYCRYMACMKMVNIGVPMTFKVFLARGGLQLDNINTVILFSRGKFTKLRIDDFSLTRNITIPVFKGRPRKKKRKELMLLKKRKQKKLLREVKKWKLESKKKRKYTKRANKDIAAAQDGGHSSVSSAASRIINKYKKKNEKTELAAKKEIVGKSLVELSANNENGETDLETDQKKSKYIYPQKKARKPDDGRLMINKLKKAALLDTIEPKQVAIGNKNEINNEDIQNGVDESGDDNNKEEDSNNKNENNKDAKNKEVVDKKCDNLESSTGENIVALDLNKMCGDESTREEFMKELHAIMDASGKPIIKVPSMGKAQVDLFELYILVTQYGGYSQVTMKRQWREIYDGLGRHSNDITNAATSVRKIYENLLLLYENKKRKKDGVVQEKCEKENPGDICKTEISIATDNSSKYKEQIAECKTKSSKEGKQKSTVTNRPKKYKKHKEKRLLVATNPLRCEYKRINSSMNEDVPLSTYIKNENNMLEQFSNGDMLPSGTESAQNHTSNPQNEGNTSFTQNEGNTSFTIQAGEAFKLMIQKRRGRPSKDFREQIEQLKTLNHKVEVKVFPPIGKRTRLPKWLNELNVDIVNPRRKRKYSVAGGNVKTNGARRYVSSKIEIPPLAKEEIPRVSHNSLVSNFNEAGPSKRIPNSFPKSSKPPEEYASMVAISPDEKVHNHLEISNRSKQKEETCEFVIESVQSLAKSPLRYPSSSNVQSYAHFPSVHPITFPQSVHPFNEFRPKYSSSLSSRNRAPLPRYPISSSITCSELNSQTYSRNPISDNELKRPNLRSFGCKITGPNTRQIYIPNDKKHTYPSDHRLHRGDVKKNNIHTEKIYIHRPPHLMLHNGKTDHKPITHISVTQNFTLIPAPTDSKFSNSNITFHNYVPSSGIYISPSSTIMHKSMNGNPLLEDHQTVEPSPPKVYILPEEYPLEVEVPTTSV